jgi:hypothetical protein
LRAKRKWNLFLEDAKVRNPKYIITLEEIHRFFRGNNKGKGDLRWNAGKKFGSFRIYIDNLFLE